MNAEHMSFELDDAKRHFFKNCQYVTRAPACVFLEGDKFSEKAKVLPIPLYAYAGIEEGKFKDFEYEEYNSHNKTHFAGLNLVEKVMIDAPLRAMERRFERDRIKKMYGKKFRKHPLYRRIIPDSGDLTQRKLYYPLFFYEFLKRDEKYRDKVKNCFKLKIWSDIDSMSGLNDDAAIATSSAMLLCREFFYDDARFLKLNELRKDLFEEIAIDYTFMKIFGIASALHFVTSGAAVFASLLGCSREQEIINYESQVGNKLKKILEFFGAANKKDIKENDKTDWLKKYFSVYMPNNVFDKIYRAEPLFEWSFEKLTSKDKLAISIIQRHVWSLFDKGLNILPSNPEIESRKTSWRTFVMLGEPRLIALCERFPEKHLFNIPENKVVVKRRFKNVKGSFFSTIYNTQRKGWGSRGASFTEIKKPEREARVKYKIDFSKKEIQVDSKKTLMRSRKGIKQEFLLLEEVLNKGEIHWSAGFVLFKRWQKNVPKKGPIEQFRQVVSDLNRILGAHLLVSDKRKETRIWALNKTADIESTIEKAGIICKKMGKLDKLPCEELKKAFSFYPESIEASKLLVRLLEKHKDNKSLDKELENKLLDAQKLLREREDNLRSAITMIQTKGNKCRWEAYWGEAKEYLWLMMKERCEIEQYKIRGEAFLRGIEVSPDEARCRALLNMISLVKKSPKKTFADFIKEPEIHECIKVASTKFMQKVADKDWEKEKYKDIENNAILFLWEEINHWKPPKAKKTTELKNYLIAVSFYRLLAWFLEEKFEIAKEKQPDLWRSEKVRRELKSKLGSNPTIDDLAKALGSRWDRGRVKEILAYEERMGGFVDIDNYYEYFNELKFDLEDYLSIMEREA